jgi:hypothetical protein
MTGSLADRPTSRFASCLLFRQCSTSTGRLETLLSRSTTCFSAQSGTLLQVCFSKFLKVPARSQEFHSSWYITPTAQSFLGLCWLCTIVYFNPRHDRLFIQTGRPDELSWVARYIAGYDASRIIHLIIPMRDFVKGDELLVSDCLPYFCNTRKLTLYYGNGRLDNQILHPAEFKRHVRGINACIVSSWFK